MELCQQFIAGIGVDHQCKWIAQVEAIDTKQRFCINRVSPGNQIHFIRIFGKQINEILDLIDLLHFDL